MFHTFLALIAAFVIRLCPALHQQITQATATTNIEDQPVRPPSPQPQSPSQLEPLLAVQDHPQWQEAVIGFCFSYALGVSLQHMSDHRLPSPSVLLSFLVLLTFIFILAAFFIHPKCTTTSKALQKVGLLLAAAAFCHALSIPLSFELKPSPTTAEIPNRT
ncbi:hypothetical protein V6N13_142499 [Hibiscus sabdariffa]